MDVVLQTKDLVKQFGDFTAVDKLNLQIHEGEIFGFLGPNGAGKSTSINMICGLLKPTSGQIFLHGIPVTAGSRGSLLNVGVCPQNIILYQKLTCLEQLVFMGEMYGIPRKTAKERSLKLLQEMGLTDKKSKLSSTLSGGMQRRLNIIMALVHDPGIVVLDEPEAGLDPQSRVMVRDYIKSLARIKTVILTTHNMDEAERVCDRIAIIDHGKMLVTDTPHNLKKTIGQGDLLEIELFEIDDAGMLAVVSEITNIGLQASSHDHSLVVRSKAIIEKLPQILETLKNKAFQVGDIKLRENSLEDVFISLTGRRLRE